MPVENIQYFSMAIRKATSTAFCPKLFRVCGFTPPLRLQVIIFGFKMLKLYGNTAMLGIHFLPNATKEAHNSSTIVG